MEIMDEGMAYGIEMLMKTKVLHLTLLMRTKHQIHIIIMLILLLRYLLDDHVDYRFYKQHIFRKITSHLIILIIGWVSDGYPIYGPYGYSDPTDTNSVIRRMIYGYKKRDITNRTSYPMET